MSSAAPPPPPHPRMGLVMDRPPSLYDMTGGDVPCFLTFFFSSIVVLTPNGQFAYCATTAFSDRYKLQRFLDTEANCTQLSGFQGGMCAPTSPAASLISRTNNVLSDHHTYGSSLHHTLYDRQTDRQTDRQREREQLTTFLLLNHLTPNGHYMGRTAQLTSRCCILYIYSTNIRTEYFKRGA